MRKAAIRSPSSRDGFVRVASHYSVNCLRRAVGERFVARARVIKPGRTQVSTTCELFALSGQEEKRVATGEMLLTPVSALAPA